MVEENRSESSEKDRPGDDSLAKKAEAFETGMMAERAKRQKLELEMAELKGKVDVLSTKPAEASQDFSRAELKRLVDDGKLTQEAADRTLDEQQSKRIERTVQKTVESTIGRQTQAQRVQSEIDRYKAALPDIVNEGTEARAKAASEYQYLTGLGHPDSVVTELAALRAAFGPAERLVNGKVERETSQDVGSDGGDSEHPDKDGAPKGLGLDARKYYEKQIETGQYKDWAAVKKALNRASPGVRQRLGAA